MSSNMMAVAVTAILGFASHGDAASTTQHMVERRGRGDPPARVTCFAFCNGNFASWFDRATGQCTCNEGWNGFCCSSYAGECTQGMENLCSQDNIVERVFDINNLVDADGKYQGPITLGTAKDNLPPRMQGVYWLQNQGGSSSLMTFGPSKDGRGISMYKPGEERQMSIRVAGDKTWASASRSFTYTQAYNADLIYQFEGTPRDDPTSFRIYPQSLNLANFELSGIFSTLLDLRMTHIDTANGGTHKFDTPTDTRPAAECWARDSSSFNNDLSDSYYELCQLFTADGTPTTAYDAYMEYNLPSSGAREAWQDGKIYYREATW